MKILTVIGARPQFIKLGVVSRELSRIQNVNDVIIHTGQHYDDNMSKVFFDQMEIPEPKYNLNINSLSHGAMTGRMLENVEIIMQKENPDWVLVYGDTNSTLAGALAAKKLHLRVAHIEAGLRSFNLKMPEEINRILTDRISDILFCPTIKSVDNLSKEGFQHFPCQIVHCGDVMEDAALFYEKVASQHSNILEMLNIKPEEFILCTIHREENLKEKSRIKNIVEAINEIGTSYQIKVVFPMHPGTGKRLNEVNLFLNATVIPPVSYFDMITLLKNSKFVITDSGGLQKEAYFFNKYCVTIREETEWVELVQEGYNRLTGTNKMEILEAIESFLNLSFEKKHSFYGGGSAGAMIVDTLINAR